MQKTAYDMRISDWSSDVCSSDLNKDVFADFTEKKNADLGQLWLEHGKPMLFAKGTKGLRLNLDHLHLEVVDIVDGDWAAAGVLVHDERNRTTEHMLVAMPFGPFPMDLCVIYDDSAPPFESAVVAQHITASQGKVAELQTFVSQ